MPEASACHTLLALDYGQKRIGIAVGTTLTGTSHPLATVRNRRDGTDWDHLGQLIRTWEPEALVLGLPLHADGSSHALSEEVRRFARQLEGRFRLKVYLVDEHLTSWEAAQALTVQRQQGRRRRIRREEIDAGAAQRILQDFLEGCAHDPA